MNKPNWKDAPEWANYLAQDCDGMYYFYADRPTPAHGKWFSEGTCTPASSLHTYQEWDKTLEAKPADTLSTKQVKSLIQSGIRNLFFDLEKQCNVEIVGYDFQADNLGYGYAADSNFTTLVSIKLNKLVKPSNNS